MSERGRETSSAPFSAELIRRADENYRELFRALARLTPHGAIEEDNELLLVRSGPWLPLNNIAIVKQPPAHPAKVLERAEAFFAAYGQPCALSATDDAAAAMAPVMARHGRSDDPSPGMILSPLAGEPAAVPGLSVEPVSDLATLRQYNDTMTAGFGNAWAVDDLLEGRALLDAPDLTHYLGVLDGRPVGTAMRFTSHRIAGVFNVSTVPDYRRRGIGAALTWRAALDGLAQGCLASALQASTLGEPVYRGMGYRTVLTYHLWLPPDAAH
ncbi:MAG TPA: GNAT family N-acetyltransferase [Dehalococcoidia bacterium]|nr:GNAT family N-acetyltransferase [Dehalococcoidia bacterium]